MEKVWEGSVWIDAPVDAVWALVVNFNRHPEWDRFTNEIELDQPGDENGVGSQWKVREQLGVLKDDDKRSWLDHGAAPARREILQVEPGRRIAWRSHPVPKVGVDAEFSMELTAQGGGTFVQQVVNLHVPGVFDAVGRVLMPSRDRVQHEAWQRNLEQLKQIAEGAVVHDRELAAV